jgi:hypothetical protein
MLRLRPQHLAASNFKGLSLVAGYSRAATKPATRTEDPTMTDEQVRPGNARWAAVLRGPTSRCFCALL